MPVNHNENSSDQESNVDDSNDNKVDAGQGVCSQGNNHGNGRVNVGRGRGRGLGRTQTGRGQAQMGRGRAQVKTILYGMRL